jgi:hypothetical protein
MFTWDLQTIYTTIHTYNIEMQLQNSSLLKRIYIVHAQ